MAGNAADTLGDAAELAKKTDGAHSSDDRKRHSDDEESDKRDQKDDEQRDTEDGDGGARSTGREYTIEELLPNGRVPGIRDGEFQRWFDDLSPDELDALWTDKRLRSAIEDRIRQPEGLHE